MKRATGWVGVVLGLALGCGRARPPMATDGGAVPEGPDPSHRWLAFAQPHGVTLVGFDNPAAPTQKTLVDFADDSLDSITSATFNRDGTRLAYSYLRATGEYGAGAVTTPAGAALGTTWSFPGRKEPQLAWVGTTAVVARGGAGESSHLLRLGESDARDIGLLGALQFSADHATLMAHSEGRLLLVREGSEPEIAEMGDAQWDGYVARDGLGIALLIQEALAAPLLSLPAWLIHWSAPSAPFCPPSVRSEPCPSPAAELSAGDWLTKDAPIVLERTVTRRDLPATLGLMQLAVIQPQDSMALTESDWGYDQKKPYRNWGLLADGNVFLVNNDSDDLAVSRPWRVSFGKPRPTLSEVFGPVGFAQYAVASGDEQALFIVSFSKPATSELYAVSLPLDASTVPRQIFTSTPLQVTIVAPEPRGPGVLIGVAETGLVGPTCWFVGDNLCRTTKYYFCDGISGAAPLPSGFSGARWTPDASGFVGYLGNDLVYVEKTQLGVAHRLGTTLSEFVLPETWAAP